MCASLMPNQEQKSECSAQTDEGEPEKEETAESIYRKNYYAVEDKRS